VVDVWQERRALAGRINRLEFAEYRAVGWLKVAPLDEIRRSAAREDVEVVTRYGLAPNNSELDREVIRLFLGDWLCCHHPESIGAYGLEPDKFRPIGRKEALDFGEGCRFYLHDSAGGPTVRFDLTNPRVIGLAPDLIGMLWLE
jgi:hypothetical protein